MSNKMVTRQRFKIDNLGWDVTVYYTVDEDQKKEIMNYMDSLTSDKEIIESVKRNIDNAEEDTGFTYSNFLNKCSLLVIHKASSLGEFINTFEHEKNHLEMHICEALDINPYSEKAAHMSGDLAQMIIEKALYSIISL